MAEIFAKSKSQGVVSTVTTVISVKDLGNGKYELNEIESDPFAPPDMHSGNRQQIDFGLPIPGLAVSPPPKHSKPQSDMLRARIHTKTRTFPLTCSRQKHRAMLFRFPKFPLPIASSLVDISLTGFKISHR